MREPPPERGDNPFAPSAYDIWNQTDMDDWTDGIVSKVQRILKGDDPWAPTPVPPHLAEKVLPRRHSSSPTHSLNGRGIEDPFAAHGDQECRRDNDALLSDAHVNGSRRSLERRNSHSSFQSGPSVVSSDNESPESHESNEVIEVVDSESDSDSIAQENYSEEDDKSIHSADEGISYRTGIYAEGEYEDGFYDSDDVHNGDQNGVYTDEEGGLSEDAHNTGSPDKPIELSSDDDDDASDKDSSTSEGFDDELQDGGDLLASEDGEDGSSTESTSHYGGDIPVAEHSDSDGLHAVEDDSQDGIAMEDFRAESHEDGTAANVDEQREMEQNPRSPTPPPIWDIPATTVSGLPAASNAFGAVETPLEQTVGLDNTVIETMLEQLPMPMENFPLSNQACEMPSQPAPQSVSAVPFDANAAGDEDSFNTAATFVATESGAAYFAHYGVVYESVTNIAEPGPSAAADEPNLESFQASLTSAFEVREVADVSPETYIQEPDDVETPQVRNAFLPRQDSTASTIPGYDEAHGVPWSAMEYSEFDVTLDLANDPFTGSAALNNLVPIPTPASSLQPPPRPHPMEAGATEEDEPSGSAFKPRTAGSRDGMNARQYGATHNIDQNDSEGPNENALDDVSREQASQGPGQEEDKSESEGPQDEEEIGDEKQLRGSEEQDEQGEGHEEQEEAETIELEDSEEEEPVELDIPVEGGIDIISPPESKQHEMETLSAGVQSDEPLFSSSTAGAFGRHDDAQHIATPFEESMSPTPPETTQTIGRGGTIAEAYGTYTNFTSDEVTASSRYIFATGSDGGTAQDFKTDTALREKSPLTREHPQDQAMETDGPSDLSVDRGPDTGLAVELNDVPATEEREPELALSPVHSPPRLKHSHRETANRDSSPSPPSPSPKESMETAPARNEASPPTSVAQQTPVTSPRRRVRASVNRWSPPTTRSRCTYQKLNIKSGDMSVTLLVPGCSINHTKLKEEEARHLGIASDGEQSRANVLAVAQLHPEISTKLSRIVGLDIVEDEGQCGVLDATEGAVELDRSTRRLSTRPLTFKTPDPGAAAPSMTLTPSSVGLRRKRLSAGESASPLDGSHSPVKRPPTEQHSRQASLSSAHGYEHNPVAASGQALQAAVHDPASDDTPTPALEATSPDRRVTRATHSNPQLNHLPRNAALTGPTELSILDDTALNEAPSPVGKPQRKRKIGEDVSNNSDADASSKSHDERSPPSKRRATGPSATRNDRNGNAAGGGFWKTLASFWPMRRNTTNQD